jgi:putative redox protein
MTAAATWAGGLRFVHTSGSGHTLVTDAPQASGGGGTAPSPMELLLLGLVGCTGVDVADILQRMRQPLGTLEITAEARRADDHPRVFTRIHLTYTLRGDLDEGKVKQAIELSEIKYCSAAAMLGKTAAITHEYRILKAG